LSIDLPSNLGVAGIAMLGYEPIPGAKTAVDVVDVVAAVVVVVGGSGVVAIVRCGQRGRG